ncbi:MarR family winged helix-turn-helix transcriptional regulator [Ignavigranum ruoffiae]|uniref:MarR family winged helix-turn-helix transcriptional regulator n=1 Tax=Ignavigranum ruoffiae TaxID=89093 RepID=UPI00206377A9|nr:MarR family transcriptional regulator [Ignavigranum ruoffiae]UPQ85645.1 MarR family transcriptional regulator [Ignavigranum ruoffiae]
MKKELLEQIYQVHVGLSRFPIFNYCSQIPHGEYLLLQYLDRHAQELDMLTVSQMAKTFNISAPAVSRASRNLIDRGWVQRQENPNDRRIIYMSLTPSGQQHFNAQNKIFQEKMEAIFGQLSEEELKTWVEIGQKIEALMSQEFKN